MENYMSKSTGPMKTKAEKKIKTGRLESEQKEENEKEHTGSKQ